MTDTNSTVPDTTNRRRFIVAQLVVLVVGLIGAAGTLGAAWIAGKTQETQSKQPVTFIQTISNGFQIIVNMVAGSPSSAAPRAAPAPAPVEPAPPPRPAPPVAPEAVQPAPAKPLSLDAFPRYEDASIRAYGMTSSLGNGGRGTVVPVRIENKLSSDLVIGYDADSITTITSDTGETNGNSGGCNVGGIRPVSVARLPKPVDQIQFSAVAGGASLTLQVACFLATADATKVNRVNINIPLLRVEQDAVKRFTLNLDGIPVYK